MKSDIIIFDLDGTLLDSSDGILFSLKHVTSIYAPEYLSFIKTARIGPPIVKLLGDFIKNKNVIALLSKEFRLHYDEIGMLKTKLFPGVYNGLKDLSSSKRLYISTNKPKKVSLTILDNLGIRSFFSSVYATNIGKYKEKKDIVEEIIFKNVGSRGTVAGDSLDDYKSALSNGLDFVYCSYGYGKIDDDVKCVHDAKELFSYLKYS